MTGADLKKIMDDHHLSLQTVAIRVSCILERPFTGGKIRGWFAQNMELDPKLTKEGILSHHSRAPYMWEGKNRGVVA